jgi:hypothetical protein
MENNNIDDFFRQHSHTVDEAPDDALWQRIETQLPAVSSIQPKRKTNFSWSKLLLVLMVTAAIIVSSVVFMRNKNAEIISPAVKAPATVVATKEEIEQDTVKKKKPVKDATSKEQAPPFRRIQKKTITKQEEATILFPGKLDKNTLKPEPTPESKAIKTTKVYNPKRTIVTINEKVSQNVFDSITKSNIEKYKNHAGMQLIVKEPRSGHVFRTKFENAFKPGRLTFEQKKDSLATNGIKLVPPKIKYIDTPITLNLDSLKKVNNTLLIEPIRFKPDSIPH